MLCCLDPPRAYAPVDTNNSSGYHNKTRQRALRTEDGLSDYPGVHRRKVAWATKKRGPPANVKLVKTEGNALVAYNPNTDLPGETVAVVVPEGMLPGETVHVSAPDGSGRMVEAVVPAGVKAGSTFLVQFPASPVAAGVPILPPTAGNVGCVSEQIGKPGSVGSVEGITQQEEKKQPPDLLDSVSCNGQHQPTTDESLILVQVPDGVGPGSKIRVPVPGEGDRFVEAVVPAGNVKEFYVSYDAQGGQQQRPVSGNDDNGNRQNWHDNPAAYAAPMPVAPFLL